MTQGRHLRADAAADCPLCGAASTQRAIARVDVAPVEALRRISAAHPEWHRADGACPACVQEVLLELVHERGDEALRDAVQERWPLDPDAAFGAIPTRLRLRADPGYSGKGVTIALLDAGFYPHPDLVEPRNRIRAWVDTAEDPVQSRFFQPGEMPRWPGWDDGHPSKWHGLMTSVAAAGNGRASQGFYRGMAAEADLVLIRVRRQDGSIRDDGVVRALRWILDNRSAVGIRVVSMSIAGDATEALVGHPVDQAVADLVAAGVVVVAAAGNDGIRRLIPPATAPHAITVGGIDDRNTFDRTEVELWHSNFGESVLGAAKPEVVAPSLNVVAPILPGSELATEAAALFARRFGEGELEPSPEVESAITERRLVGPKYQQVEGTSFAAPIVAGTVACMLEANPGLTPRQVKDALIASAWPVAGASRDRQGAGAVDAGRAVAAALVERHHRLLAGGQPVRLGPRVILQLHDHAARTVALFGSWNGWSEPGVAATWVEPGLFEVAAEGLAPGLHYYKFRLDGTRWSDDPANPRKSADGFGGYNSVLEVTEG